MESLNVKCPHCGAVLSIKVNSYEASAEKILSCAVCKTKNKLRDYKIYVKKEQSDETHFQFAMKEDVGKITDIATKKEYALREGSNTIGRKTYNSESKASLPIDTTDMGMSRLHASLDVMKGSDGKYHVFISNLSNKNATYINGELLENDDKIGLKDGDIIKTSKTELRYSAGTSRYVEDDDETELPGR